jgi:hypothetical protein
VIELNSAQLASFFGYKAMSRFGRLAWLLLSDIGMRQYDVLPIKFDITP